MFDEGRHTMWPFKKKESRLVSNAEPNHACPPEVVRKKQARVQASRVVGLAALFSHGGKGQGTIDFLGESRSYYNTANPGLTVSIAPSDFMIVVSPSHKNIDDIVASFLRSPEIQRFGRTSKVVQVGLISSVAGDHPAIKVPTAFVTFVRVGQQEPETIEIVDLFEGAIEFVKDKTKTVEEKDTGKEPTRGYTFGRGGQFVFVIFTKPSDSGSQFYFFESKEVADAMLPAMSATIPALTGAAVVQCTLEEIQREATNCGASIEAYLMRDDSIVVRRN
jgi:hypothetical protein